MSIRVSAGLGNTAEFPINPGETLGSVLEKVKPMFNLGPVEAISDGAVLNNTDELYDGMHINLQAKTHSKAVA
tara:strand:+ start:2490 stop:2708 length:219 start_codon:yes stop_codon:yes gene_type:complete